MPSKLTAAEEFDISVDEMYTVRLKQYLFIRGQFAKALSILIVGFEPYWLS